MKKRNQIYPTILSSIIIVIICLMASSCGSKTNSDKNNKQDEVTNNNNPFANLPKTKIHELSENVFSSSDEKSICTEVVFTRKKDEKKVLQIIFPFNNQTGKIIFYEKDEAGKIVLQQEAKSPVKTMDCTITDFADGKYLAVIERKDMKRKVSIEIVTE